MDLAIKLIVLLPLLAAAIAGLFCRVIGDRPAQIVTCAALLIAAALSIFVFVKIGFGPDNAKLVVVKLFTWIDSGTLDVAWSLRVDTLTAVMLIVVTGVSSMVHVYSVGYMAEDPSIPRFMSYLSLFTFFMLMLVTSDNLVQLFFGWEGVGLASYLLIGFWYHKPEANAAAISRAAQVTIWAGRSPITRQNKPAMAAARSGSRTMSLMARSMARLPLALHRVDVFDLDGAAIAEIHHENRQTDRRLGRRHGQHQHGEDLADDVALIDREGHQVDVDREQHQLDAHQDDDDVLAVQEDAEDAQREQHCGDEQVMAEPDHHHTPPRVGTLTTVTASSLGR